MSKLSRIALVGGGEILYDEDSKSLKIRGVDDNAAKLIKAHYEIKLPTPRFGKADPKVLDDFEIKGQTGLDDAGMFMRRTMELLTWTGIEPDWKKSDART